MMAITIPLLILEVLVGVGVVSFPSYERSHLCLYGTWYMLAFHLSFLLVAFSKNEGNDRKMTGSFAETFASAWEWHVLHWKRWIGSSPNLLWKARTQCTAPSQTNLLQHALDDLDDDETA
jgi:hypothetical protein